MPARVDSIDALREFKVALWKFMEAATQVLSDVDSHMQRMHVWLEVEQIAHWQGQIRSRTEAVARAKEALRAKRIFLAEGARPSDVEEQKALKRAVQRLDEGNEKLSNVRRSIQRLGKEILLYKGQAQRLANFVAIELPQAAAQLDRLIATLDTYVGLAPEAAAPSEVESTAATVPGEPELPPVKRPEPESPILKKTEDDGGRL